MNAPARTTAALPATLAHLAPRVAAAVTDAAEGLRALYGQRLARVVLYGSQARGDAHPESDIDLLVVLHDDVRPYDEIKRTSLLGMDLLLDHELSVSMQPYTLEAYETAQSGYMQNVRREGIEL